MSGAVLNSRFLTRLLTSGEENIVCINDSTFLKRLNLSLIVNKCKS